MKKGPTMIKSIGNWFKSLFAKPVNKFQMYGSNLKCLHCDTWSHDTEGIKSSRIDEVNDIILWTTCKKCDKESEWFCGAPMLIPMDEIRQQDKKGDKEMKVELDKGIENTFRDICMYHSVKEDLRLALYQMLIKDQELKDRFRARIEAEITRADNLEEQLNEMAREKFNG